MFQCPLPIVLISCRALLLAVLLVAHFLHHVKGLVTCGDGCGRFGTCNLEFGRCDCAIPYSGTACQQQGTDATCLEYVHTQESCCSRYIAHCLNACNGRGRCVGGVCVCKTGHYGTDCSLSMDAAGKPQLLAGADYKLRAHGPRIYVYELPPNMTVWFNVWRNDKPLNLILWQRMLGAGVRTADGDSADWYYVPVHTRMPLGHVRNGLVLDAIKYIRTHYPWWDALQGARHMFVSAADYGKREFNEEVRSLTANSTWLTHWGLVKDHPISKWHAAHVPGRDIVMPTLTPPGLVKYSLLAPWTCMVPVSDASDGSRGSTGRMQGHKGWWALKASSSSSHTGCSNAKRSLGGNNSGDPAFSRRTGIVFFGGSVCGSRKAPVNGTCGNWNTNRQYSAFTRQRIYIHHWNRTGYKIVHSSAQYQMDLSTYQYCLAPTGGGHGRRQVFVALMGCIPVTITDHVLQPFEPELPWSDWSVPVAEDDIPRMHEILAGIGEDKMQDMQGRLRCAAQHLYYSNTFGSIMGETGQYDAAETLFEILRMRTSYSDAKPEQYMQLDERFRDFILCKPGGSARGSSSLHSSRDRDKRDKRGSGNADADAGVGTVTGAGARSRAVLCGWAAPPARSCKACRLRGSVIGWPGGALCCGAGSAADCPRHWP